MQINIRHSEPRDVPAIHQLHTHPAVVMGTLQLLFQPEKKWKERIENPREGMYSLVAEVDGQLVGSAGAFASTHSPRMSHVGSLGMAVHAEWHGKGIGSALMAAIIDLADNWLNWVRLELTVYTDNERAIGLYKKFGFVIEGTHRKYAFRNGQYVDAHCMARVR